MAKIEKLTALQKFSMVIGLIFITLVFIVASGRGGGLFRGFGLSLFTPGAETSMSAACGVSIFNLPYLTNPTASQPGSGSSVMLSFRPAGSLFAWVEYGPVGGSLVATGRRLIAPDSRADFVLNLIPNTDYAYRVACLDPNGNPQYWFGSEFHSLAGEGDSTNVRFAVIGDTHAFEVWAKSPTSGSSPGLERIKKTFENTIRAEPSFVVLGGDRAMTHCPIAACPVNRDVDGESAGAGTIRTARQAELRYRQFLRIAAPLLAEVPGVFVLGNHEGEAGFARLGKCSYLRNENGQDTNILSENARRNYLPDYPRGSPLGNYFSFATGLLRLTVIDVMKYTPKLPQGPDDWTLGAEQKTWFENTLRGSNAVQEFVVAEHLAGGKGGPPDCYQYGRGSLKAKKVSDTILGPFLGEQDWVNELMRRLGGAIFIHSHDHVAVYGEDRDATGIPTGNVYVVAGHTGPENGPPWANQLDGLYDYNENGIPDYFESNSDYATTKPGFWLVDVSADGTVTMRYIVTDISNPDVNGTAAITKVIPAEE